MTNTCHCANPPGGTIVCPDDCIAYCRVLNGVIKAGCLKVPSRIGTQRALANWTLEWVTGKRRRSNQAFTSEDRLVLENRRYVRKDGAVMSFRMPPVRRDPSSKL